MADPSLATPVMDVELLLVWGMYWTVYKSGGPVSQRHNEVRDTVGDIIPLIYKEVGREPVDREADAIRGIFPLIANLAVKGVRQPQTEALLIFMSLTQKSSTMLCLSAVNALLSAAEREKKKKFAHSVQDCCASCRWSHGTRVSNFKTKFCQ